MHLVPPPLAYPKAPLRRASISPAPLGRPHQQGTPFAVPSPASPPRCSQPLFAHTSLQLLRQPWSRCPRQLYPGSPDGMQSPSGLSPMPGGAKPLPRPHCHSLGCSPRTFHRFLIRTLINSYRGQ